MGWLKRGMWRAGIAVAGLLLLLVLAVWVPASAGAYEGVSGTVTVQATPTEDATVTELNKEKLAQEVQQLKNQNETDLLGWFRTNAAILLSTLVVVIGALVGLFRWFGDRRDAQNKELRSQAEERFQTAVTALGDEKKSVQVGGAILLRSFLNPGDREIYGRYYTQIFDLAVAYLRLRNINPDADSPEPLDSLSQALIIAFQESFPRAREYVRREHLNQEPRYLDASKIQLDNANLAQADLKGVWMPNAVLRKAILRGADLSEANLSYVAMRKAYLSGATLDKTDFSRSDLSGTDLRGTDLRTAILDGTILTTADLREADLRKTDLSKVGTFYEARLEEAKLHEAVLNKQNLVGATLVKTQLVDAQLSGADLTWAMLTEANLSRANLSEASLEGADLSRANLGGADLTGANLSPVRTDIGYSKVSLKGANLGEANLSKANLSGARLNGADLSGANLTNATLSETKYLRARPDALDNEPFPFKANLEDALSLNNTDLRGAKGFTRVQLEVCKAKGAIIDEESMASPYQPTISTPAPSQNNDAQAPSPAPTQANIPPSSTDGSSSTTSQPSTEP